ncbi:MAG TPA: CDP-alcohol phosphatidyltransferase family protein [Candidatus Binataceae bacterium]|nr:CDP-alcohol phosphatidyltransferase family protein [Candidatus Binataceae bacterium]
MALVDAPSRGAELIFGHPLLERLIRICERAGIAHFFVRCPTQERARFAQALGRFSHDPRIRMVGSFDEIKQAPSDLHDTSQCVAVNGNIVFSVSQLRDLMAWQASNSGEMVRLGSANGDPAAWLSVGRLSDFVGNGNPAVARVVSDIPGMPFALDGHPEDRDVAERVIARTLRHDTAHTDGFMARVFDRKFSWRLSYLLAYTRITPNQVTLANTALGMTVAWMFAQPGYWVRLVASLLFVISITIDGVDGELARLTMSETPAGGRLDAITDNLVHIAIFFGISIGCYRAAHSTAYLYVLGALLVGFGMCAISVHRAMNISSTGAEAFIRKVDRLTGRDFAYLVFALALINRLNYFIIGAAIGTYMFAVGLWWMTDKWTRSGAAPQTGGDRLAEGI